MTQRDLEAGRRCLDWAGTVLRGSRDHLARRMSAEGLDAIQPEAFALARHLAQLEAARAALDWAEGQGAVEAALGTTYAGLMAADLGRWRWGVGRAPGSSEAWGCSIEDATSQLLSTSRLVGIAHTMARLGGTWGGRYGLEDTHELVREEFARFADEHLRPVAHEIHRDDRLIPEPLLEKMARLGVFGISVPEQYGGCFTDHRTLIVATEELSRGSLGAGGSVITRPEICAKALLKGGDEAQRMQWLPAISQGRKMVAVAVTEPDVGSDVGSLRCTARPIEGGYVIDGEKTWCTFAGRADVLVLLARTGAPDDGHRGLSLFLVEKPGRSADQGDEAAFDHQQPHGGRMEGRAIRTVGYRGMHSFGVRFEGWRVPAAARIGEEGEGFYLCMEGFKGGRLQTAARALGVMEAALRAAMTYAKDRVVFGRPLVEQPLTGVRLTEMAARLQAGRQLAYRVGDRMDEGEGTMEAALVKLLTARDAEWLTREAMQLHGGMGYAEEFPVSRYWQDARVLSIFEGAEEVLALRVIARTYLKEVTS